MKAEGFPTSAGENVCIGYATGDTWWEGWYRAGDHHRNALRPEFLNRIDEVVVFNPLGRDEIARVVEIQLGHLQRRLEAKRIQLEVTDAARAVLGREGYDPTFGARPLKRTIQRLVQDPLALRLLEHEFAEGDTVVVDAAGDAVTFKRAATARPVG